MENNLICGYKAGFMYIKYDRLSEKSVVMVLSGNAQLHPGSFTVQYHAGTGLRGSTGPGEGGLFPDPSKKPAQVLCWNS